MSQCFNTRLHLSNHYCLRHPVLIFSDAALRLLALKYSIAGCYFLIVRFAAWGTRRLWTYSGGVQQLSTLHWEDECSCCVNSAVFIIIQQ